MATPDESELVEIDGSMLEGGGQILRMASALSVILNKPIHVTSIRAGRSKPGLRPQHLSGLQLLRDLSVGRLKGGQVGSTEVWLWPGIGCAGCLTADTGTAGSITLLLQSLLPCLAVAASPVRLTLRGGTNVDFAPQIEYLQHVLLPLLRLHFNVQFDLVVNKKGFFPKGGGEVLCRSSGNPSKQLPAFCLVDRGEVSRVEGRAWTAGNAGIQAAGQMAAAAADSLRPLSVPVDIAAVHETPAQAFGTSSGLCVWAHTTQGCIIAADALAGKQKRPTDLGVTAGRVLLDNLAAGGCVDEHMQDQLLIYACLAAGTSRYRTGPLTLHTKTAIHIAQLMSGVSQPEPDNLMVHVCHFDKAQMNVKEDADGTNVIEVGGIGFVINKE